MKRAAAAAFAIFLAMPSFADACSPAHLPRGTRLDEIQWKQTVGNAVADARGVYWVELADWFPAWPRSWMEQRCRGNWNGNGGEGPAWCRPWSISLRVLSTIKGEVRGRMEVPFSSTSYIEVWPCKSGRRDCETDANPMRGYLVPAGGCGPVFLRPGGRYLAFRDARGTYFMGPVKEASHVIVKEAARIAEGGKIILEPSSDELHKNRAYYFKHLPESELGPPIE